MQRATAACRTVARRGPVTYLPTVAGGIPYRANRATDGIESAPQNLIRLIPA